jgi:hypothetical protein
MSLRIPFLPTRDTPSTLIVLDLIPRNDNDDDDDDDDGGGNDTHF